MLKRINDALKTNIITPLHKGFIKSKLYIKSKPFTFFVIILAITFGLIVLSSGILKSKPIDETKPDLVKEVKIQDINTNPSLSFNAEVKKDGVVSIVAQTSGIVNKINFTEGSKINKGSPILYIASNYNGQNINSISKEISYQTYLNSKNTYNERLDIINKNKDILNDSEDETTELDKIKDDSIDRTEDLIDLNKSILDTINSQIKNLENNGASDSDTLSLRSQKSQVQSVLNQLESSKDNDEFNTDKDSETKKIQDNKKEVSVKQLDLEKKALDLSLKTSELQYKLAAVTESFSYPTSPFNGLVEKVNVKENDLVNPGQILASVSTTNKKAVANITINKSIAEKLDIKATHKVYINGKAVDITLKFVSTEAINDSLFNASFDIPNDYLKDISDKTNLKVDLSLLKNDAKLYPIIPIESVYQTKTHNFIYVIEDKDGKSYAKSKSIELGENLDGFIEITKGLEANEKVIITRNISAGDEVKY